MRVYKKKELSLDKITARRNAVLPLLVFLIGMSILAGITYNIRSNQQKQNRITARLNAMTYAERMKNEVMSGIGVTETLQQILISEGGQIDRFYKVAQDMMTDSIQSIQLAPNGVVTDIYPVEGNEAGKIDLIHDEERGRISCYARDHHTVVMQGPFELKQGGYGIAVRNPVYLEIATGQQSFWGFTIVIIRVPDIFADSVKALSNFGYQYRLSKSVSPWNTKYEEVCTSGGKIVNPVYYKFEMGGSSWKLEVMPKDGWIDHQYMYAVLIGGILIVLLLTGLTAELLSIDEHRKQLKKIAVTDGLTNVYNRHGFEELVTQYLLQNPDKPCVTAQFDVDDFKFINDMYGHATGDMALEILSKSMQEFFTKEAVLGRNGGDEFCIFLPNCTCEDVKEQMEQFTEIERKFRYGEVEHVFSISLGYAEYPEHAKNYADLMRCADVALYQVKLRGKHGCMAYRDGLRLEIRKRLGFALKDVSENLPGAFIIYKADKDDDELLFANREMVRLTGCKNMDELFTYTGKSFRNLIHEDEYELVERSIWEQIEDGHSNDYVHFHMRKKDGTYLKVLDHGRIVDSAHYGRVFYVLILDWNSMQRHYGDKVNFSDEK